MPVPLRAPDNVHPLLQTKRAFRAQVLGGFVEGETSRKSVKRLAMPIL
jgi:hypothetical protein